MAYALFATLWIYFSDRALGLLIDDPETLLRVSVYKGFAFVGVTTLLLLLLLTRVYGTLEQSHALLQSRQAALTRINSLNAVLGQINQASMRTTKPEDLYVRACELLAGPGGFPLAIVARAPDGALAAAAGASLDRIAVRSILTQGDSPAAVALAQQAPCIRNRFDAGKAPAPELRAALALPLFCDGRIVSVLAVYASEPGWFGDHEADLLREAAADIAFALEYHAREDERRAAEARAGNERRFSEVMIDSMPGILYFYDHDGHLLRWNRNFETVSGYSREEVARMHPLDFFAPEDRDLVAARIGETFAAGDSYVEAPFRTKDGRSLPYFFTGRRVIYEGQACLVGVGIDVTERKQAEAAWREAQGRLEIVVENLREGLVISEPSGNFLHWNPAALRLLGFTDLAEGRRRQRDFAQLFELRHLDGTSLPPENWPLARVRRGETVDGLELRVRRLDCEFERIIGYSGAQVRYAGDRTLAFLAFSDITARKEAERFLRDANEMLEQKVAARTGELDAARQRAEAADRIKSAFLATMSHELRTPLNSIIGFTGILLQGLAGALNEEQSRQLGMVRGSARHLLELINDVLDISKIEAGQLEVRAEAFDAGESITRVSGTIRPLAEKKGLELRLRLDPDLGEILGDRRRVEQILLNLLNNAIKFTERGTVTLAADAGPAGPGSAVPTVRIAVTDTGIGIKPGDLATLFQPFRQIDTGLSRQHEGTGLGLAICRRLAELMGGTITATSEWGHGSTFIVNLPRARPAAPCQPAPSS